MSRRRDVLSGLAMAARLRRLQEAAAETAARQAQIVDLKAQEALHAAEKQEEAALAGWRSVIASDRLDLDRLAGWGGLVDRQTAATADAARTRDDCADRLRTARDGWSAARSRTALAETRWSEAARLLVRQADEREVSDAAELHLFRGRTRDAH